MRFSNLIISAFFALLAIACFSFSSSLQYFSNYQKKISFTALSAPKLLVENKILNTKSIEINSTFSLEPADPKHPYLDLFQTDSYNKGLRYELIGLPDGSYTSGIVIANKKMAEGFFTFSLGNPPVRIQPHKKYRIVIKADIDAHNITCLLTEVNGEREIELASEEIRNPYNRFSIKNIAIGWGHDASRKIHGHIASFEMKYQGYLTGMTCEQMNSLAILFLLMSLGVTVLGNRNTPIPNYSFKNVAIYCLAAILFFSYPLLQLYSLNEMDVSFFVILRIMGVLSCIGILLFLLFSLVYKNLEKAFVFTLLCAFYILFLGKLYEYFSFLFKPDIFIFFALLCLLILHILLQILKVNLAFTLYLKRATYFLFAMSLISIVFYSVRPALTHWHPSNTAMKSANVAYKPDIYFILSDMHVSQASVRKHLDFDNQAFISKLKSLGFFISNNAASNYAYTVLSIPSMLNFSYIPKAINNHEQIKKYYSENALARYLKKNGYQYIFISPRRYIIEKSAIADANITCSKISDFEGVLWNHSLFFRANKLANTYRQDVLCGFHKIKESVSAPGPKFVFAHILSPHPPYVFDKDGNEVPQEQQLDLKKSASLIELNKSSYLGQLQYIENNLIELVSFILKNSKQPPIIIVQGDHGFSLYSDPMTSAGKKPPSQEYLNGRMRVLGAYYFPKGGNSVLYDTISPINMARGLLRYYFQRDDLKKLADISYWSPEMYLFATTAVTDTIRKEDNKGR